MDENISCIQINLHHCRAASYRLQALVEKQQQFIVLAQEPWTRLDKVLARPAGARVFHGAPSGTTPRAAILLASLREAWQLPQFSDKDMVAVRMEVGSNHRPLQVIFASVYLAGDLPVPSNNMIQLITFAECNNIPLVIGCDANSHHTAWGSTDINQRGADLFEYLSGTNMTWVNRGHKPTFRTRSRSEVLDLTLASANILDKITEWEVSEEPSLSDHAYIIFRVGMSPRLGPQTRNIKKTNWKLYREELDRLLSGQREKYAGEIASIEVIEECAENLNMTMKSAWEKACPAKVVWRKSGNSWWTNELTKLRKSARASWKRATRSGLTSDWEAHRAIQREYKKLIEKTKKDSWRRFCGEVEAFEPTARLMKMIKRDNHTRLSTVQKTDGTFTLTPEETISVMLDHHVAGGERDEGTPTDTQEREGGQLAAVIFTRERCKAAVDLFSPYKSPGGDGLYPAVLQQGWGSVGDLLITVFRVSFSFGYVPRCWMETRGVFIPKPAKESYLRVNSFRLITLSSFVLKIMERVIYWYLQDLPRVAAALHPNQFGFVPGRSTEAALHQLVWRLEKTIIDGQFGLALFMDIEGAFDNVKFQAFEVSMQKFHIPVPIIRWIGYMIKHRKITVGLEGMSCTRRIGRGCPQGGVLSPFLWNVVMNTLFVELQESGAYVQAFADDLVILFRGMDLNTLHSLAQRCLDDLRRWGERCGLKFNPLKSNVMIFTWKKKNTMKPLRLGECLLPVVSETKYLGVILDSKLTWKAHVWERSRLALAALMQCKRVVGATWGLQPRQMKWIYTAIVRPMLAYGCCVWVNAVLSQTLLKQLEKVQRTACVMITGALKSTPTAALEFLLGIPPMDTYLLGESYKTMYRLERGGTWTKRSQIGTKAKLRSHVDICGKGKHDIKVLSMPKDSMTPAWIFGNKFRVDINEKEIINLEDLEGAIVCYTDGSKIEKTGAGVYLENNTLGLPQRTPIFLGLHVSVFQAEAIAIGQAAQMLADAGVQGKEITIFSDSQAVLKALMHPRRRQGCIVQCVRGLNKLCNNNNLVRVSWVRGHSGNEGNETADDIAKEGTRLCVEGPEPFYPLSYSTCKTEVDKWCRKDHKRKWNSRTDCRQARRSIGNAKLDDKLLALDRKQIRMVTQVLTGHATLSKHLYTCGKVNSPLCPVCGLEEETAEHLVGVCPAEMNSRFKYLEVHNTTIKEVVDTGQIRQLACFLARTGRLRW